MTLSENIIRFRKANGLSQEQLANKLNISRQSISKWENGNTLPSIDNLICLSGLLDISLDELITGEPYLSFPFNFGKPKNKIPAIILIVVLILTVLFAKKELKGNIGVVIGGIFLSVIWIYSIAVYAFSFDFKRYYSYWTLDKKGIRYATSHLRSLGVRGCIDEYVMPLKAFLHLREEKFIQYSEIKSIEIVFEKFARNPDKAFGIGPYTPRATQLMRENFYFKVTTNNGDIICLDLRQYYYRDSKEHKSLSSIISFLKRKNIEYIDNKDLSKIISTNKDDFIQQVYKM